MLEGEAGNKCKAETRQESSFTALNKVENLYPSDYDIRLQPTVVSCKVRLQEDETSRSPHSSFPD